nr:hypothetical protein [Tanacetum cinerariifolium]
MRYKFQNLQNVCVCVRLDVSKRGGNKEDQFDLQLFRTCNGGVKLISRYYPYTDVTSNIHGELETPSRVPTNLDDRHTTLPYAFGLTVHDFDGFFDEVKLVIDLNLIQQNEQCFVRRTLLQGTSLTQWTVSSMSMVLSWSSSIGSESFWSSILLLTKIIRAIVTDVLVVVAIVEFVFHLLDLSSRTVLICQEHF